MALKTNRVLRFIWHSPLIEWPLAILGERPCIRTASVTCLKVASVSKIHRLLLSTIAGNFECWLSDVAKLIFHAFGDEMDSGITACASAARRLRRARPRPAVTVESMRADNCAPPQAGRLQRRLGSLLPWSCI